ncbi:hypothetical protein BJ166DRAFT_612903 [Pestalotiopsis sp. NC0098]|nr:hypothetical protein BJ166DRAFT_612903 [Pestalotiopsis sp. NC0098]
MSEKKAPSTDNALFFFTVVKHMKTKPDTDWDAVATELGYSNANTARVRFGQITRKLGLTLDKNATTPKVNKVTKSTPKSKDSAKAKKVAAKFMEERQTGAELDMDVDDTVPNTPTPFFKTEARARAMKLEGEDEKELPDYEDDEV